MEYIDLGVESGTLWAKDIYEEDDNIFFKPQEIYDKKDIILPSVKQFNELKECCNWQLCKCNQIKDNGETIPMYAYKVIGKNGNYIIFPIPKKLTIGDCELPSYGYYLSNKPHYEDEYDENYYEVWCLMVHDNNNIIIGVCTHYADVLIKPIKCM